MISKVLIKLLEAPVKPEHPIDFIRDNLGASSFERKKIEQLEQQVAGYKQEVADLKQQVDELKTKLNEKTVVDETEVPKTDETNEKLVEKETKTDVKEKENEAGASAGGANPDVENKVNETEKAIVPATITDEQQVKSEEAATADDVVAQAESSTSATNPAKDSTEQSKTDAINAGCDDGKNKDEVTMTTVEKKPENKKKDGKKGKNGGKKSNDADGKSGVDDK